MKKWLLLACVHINILAALDFDMIEVHNKSTEPVFAGIYIVSQFDGSAQLFKTSKRIGSHARSYFERPVIMPGKTRFFVLSSDKQRLKQEFDQKTFKQLKRKNIESMFQNLQQKIIINKETA